MTFNYEKMKEIVNKKEVKICKIVLITLVVIFTSFWNAACKDSSFLALKEQLSADTVVDSKKYKVDEFNLVNIESHNNQLVASTNDPQLIFKSIAGYVDNISIRLAESLNEDMYIQVFYSENGSGFSEEKSVKHTAHTGDQEILIPVMKQVDSLRIDIGNEPGQTIMLGNISVNEEIYSLNAFIQKDILGSSMFWIRFELLFLLYAFIGCHFIFNIKKMYAFIYKYRWIIGGLVIVFMTVNKFHGDSTYVYDTYIQPGLGSEYMEPVLGVARPIRSDEWLTNTSRILSSRHLENPYGKYNDIMRATDTINLTNGGMVKIGSDALAVFYRLLGIEYGFCFIWNARIVLSFLVTFEFFMILARRRKLLALLGTCLIICSGFFLWWQFPSIILTSHAALVCVYHYFTTHNRKIKALCAIGAPIATSNFVLILFPAWQVPLGYVVLALLVWMIHDNWEDIKRQSKKSWAVFGAALVICGILIISYTFSIKEYTEIISNTVYPGARSSNGGFILNKVLYYIQNFLYPYKDVGNPSEYGTLCTLFPLPVIMGIVYLIKNKKKDWLVGCLLVPLALLLGYTATGLPGWLAKISMFTNSTPERAADILGVCCVYLLIAVMARDCVVEKIKWWVGFLAGLLVVSISTYTCMKYYPEYMTWGYIIFMSLILAAFAMIIISKVKPQIYNAVICVMIAVLVVSGLAVRPVQKGFDAIDSKPLAVKIREISGNEPDEKWIAAGGLVLSGLSIACGAPTINSVNTYPNMDLWTKLDEDLQYGDIYNRFEHVIVDFNNEKTTFELFQADTIIVHLAYQDFVKTGAKYVVSDHIITEDNQYLSFTLLYGEGGSYIYQINYK